MLSEGERSHFNEWGYLRVTGAFSAADAAAMRAVVWQALERQGIRRDDPSSWTNEFPAHLQSLKDDPAFEAIGTERTLGAIDDIVGRGRWRQPRDWGAYFILFPNPRPWTVPWSAWHLDHAYTSLLAPFDGLKVHSMFGDVAPRAGGMTIVAGSHRLVAQHFEAHPPRPGTRAAQLRAQLMQSSDYLRVLGTEGGGGESRIARFVDGIEVVDGVPVQVVELTANAGDVILIHPLVLHTRPTNAGTQPRFLLNKDLSLTSPAA
ncbi:MAG TPA: phytanoyl-CoA dioxygenase family protein [Acidimicrobiales bacterium]|nr:phytanoyl-CoA dioxygenase family protein [Acidimicrobiales bacterium]